MDGFLLVTMIERLSVVAILAFLLSQLKLFHRINYQYATVADRLKLSVVFGLIGIAGTYTGIPVEDALANSRAVGVMTAGFVGGPAMGIGAGAIAGTHRYFLGGFTDFSCALSSVLEGLFAGMIKWYFPHRMVPWRVALVGGVVGEMLQMAIILATAAPAEAAVRLVSAIALPMIVANSMGLAVFMLMIQTVSDAQIQAGAMQAQRVLLIAAQTLPHFRRGVNEASARAAARIIHAHGRYHAVEIADKTRILAFVGAEMRHHAPASGTFTAATQQVLADGKICVAETPQEIGYRTPGCALKSAIIAPLRCDGNTIGVFALYYTAKNLLNQTDVVFADGLAQLFSIQLELAEAERRSAQVARAELKALQAQINPHFLFNTLNTIISLVRTQPVLARELLVKLSGIFRFTLHKTGKDITLAEELERVDAYLAIEKARYGDKITFQQSLSLNPAVYMIASLTVQPLIENAVQHGLRPKQGKGVIALSARDDGGQLVIEVADDGVGFDLALQHPLETALEGHIGLRNVHERLRSQHGALFGLTIASEVGRGTTVTMRIPRMVVMEGEIDVKNFDCG